jgi:hypothetical protein
MQFSRQDTAHFLASTSAEMAKLAEGAGLDTLAYLFKMAILEAEAAMKAAAPVQKAA